MQIVWFKRDLRLQDHEAMAMAIAQGSVLPLYILEPKLWQQPDLSHRHYQFLCECLLELAQECQALGQGLVIKVGDAVEVLEDLRGRHTIEGLYSHQETWNAWTYERDKQVKAWCLSSNIPWHEPTHNGVIRCLSNRDGWASRWYARMKKPVAPSVRHLEPITEPSDELPLACALELEDDGCRMRQRGGRMAALESLYSFLDRRGEGYTKEMSSPVTAYESCSRLSPYLAFGVISIREVFQAAEQRQAEIKQMPRGNKGKWGSAMRSFMGRLRWHCHFIQKLEDEPRIEFENLHSAYDGLREPEFNEAYFAAWKTGMTGYPMVDACMRALTTTGWINFRMRAMLMSFASAHLWLHWRETALHLARLFTDYEPGIHYSQVQMQSGTTGINAIRIYNPIKQGIDQDPDGVFIRRWVPELADVPNESIHKPWEVKSKARDYPAPIVDEVTARKAAAAKLYGLRKSSEHRQEANQIVSKHGSRKSLTRKTSKEAPRQD